MTKWIGMMLGLALCAIALTACTTGQSASGQDANGTYNSGAAPAKNAISLSQYRSVAIGTPCSDITFEFGPPADKQDFSTGGYHDVTLMYNDVNASGDFAIPQYSFDCVNGKLDSKANV